jgi:hypothetical protein
MMGLLFVPLLAFGAQPVEWIASGVDYAKCTGVVGSTNTSSTGAGADIAHSPTCTTDASQLPAGATVRTCALLKIVTGSGPGALSFKLKSGAAGNVIVSSSGATFVPGPSLNQTGWNCVTTVIGAVPGPAVATYSAPETYASGTTFLEDSNGTVQPVNLATNGALIWNWVSRWESAGTGVNSVQLLALSVMMTR